MSDEQSVIAAEGTAPNGDTWSVRYSPYGLGNRHFVALFVNGGERQGGSGFDIPGTTEIGFSSGLKRGEGNYHLYGLTSTRIRVIRAESRDQHFSTEVETEVLSEATGDDGNPLRSFVLVRPPVDNVTALVGLDRDGQVVQRIPLLGPFE